MLTHSWSEDSQLESESEEGGDMTETSTDSSLSALQCCSQFPMLILLMLILPILKTGALGI